MPVLCCGSSSVQVDQLDKNPADNGAGEENEEGESEVAGDAEEGQVGHSSNGRVKSSSHKMTYEVNPDPDTSATATTSSPGRDPASANNRASRKGRKLPKKKGSLTPAPDDAGGDDTTEKAADKSTPSKKKNAKKSSFRDTEEMEMSPLGPGFYNSGTLQSSRQLYSQQTFEEEEEDLLESMEEERRKNKHRQRMKKKQASSGSAPALTSAADPMQAAYERAQHEIDKVLGPRNDSAPSVLTGAATGEDKDKRRSRRQNNRRGEVSGGNKEEAVGGPGVGGQEPSESLDEMKSRVHALLDDAFSLMSSSYTSMGNRVAPVSPSKQGGSESPTQEETQPPVARSSPPSSNMPAVEEVQGWGKEPKPGEKLHTPVLVDRTYGDYDADGLITWSPYRAADDSARIVMPDAQVPIAKAPIQERVQTTTFVESATANGPHYYHQQQQQPHHPYPPAHSAPPLVLRTRQARDSNPATSDGRQNGTAQKTSAQLAAAVDSQKVYTPYQGLETYEEMLTDATTTTALFTAPASSSGESIPDKPPSSLVSGEDPETTSPPQQPDPPAHKPPTRNVGTRDERDFIASSLSAGTSPKELVDSIRQELRSLSGKVPLQEEGSNRRREKLSKTENGNLDKALKTEVAGDRGKFSNGTIERLCKSEVPRDIEKFSKTEVSNGNPGRLSKTEATGSREKLLSKTDVSHAQPERQSTIEVTNTRTETPTTKTEVTSSQPDTVSKTDATGTLQGMRNGSTKPRRPRKGCYES